MWYFCATNGSFVSRFLSFKQFYVARGTQLKFAYCESENCAKVTILSINNWIIDSNTATELLTLTQQKWINLWNCKRLKFKLTAKMLKISVDFEISVMLACAFAYQLTRQYSNRLWYSVFIVFKLQITMRLVLLFIFAFQFIYNTNSFFICDCAIRLNTFQWIIIILKVLIPLQLELFVLSYTFRKVIYHHEITIKTLLDRVNLLLLHADSDACRAFLRFFDYL